MKSEPPSSQFRTLVFPWKMTRTPRQNQTTSQEQKTPQLGGVSGLSLLISSRIVPFVGLALAPWWLEQVAVTVIEPVLSRHSQCYAY